MNELRKRHPRLVYHSYDWLINNQELKARFHLELEPDIHFYPTLSLPCRAEIPNQNLENLIFHLGLIECISYWKAACPEVLHIECGALDEEQQYWFKNLLLLGLGEFFFVNNLDCSIPDLIRISCGGIKIVPEKVFEVPKNQNLVLVGGGKDSALSLELLKEHENNCAAFMLNPKTSYYRTVDVAKIKSTSIVAKRTIDPKLLELNQQGYLNGHTPFSAYLAFLSLLAGSANGFGFVIASNESSASEENTVYCGIPVNHQYSKSFDFESHFRDYVKKHLAVSTEYFSFLRPLNEIQIAALFSEFKDHLPSFRSCNVGQNEDLWCGKCPKCAFVYLMLYPFLEHGELVEIFGSDLFQSLEIQKHIEQNICPTQVKPFECVGSKEESLLALKLSFDKRKTAGLENPAQLNRLLEIYAPEINPPLLKSNWDENNFLPKDYKKILESKLPIIIKNERFI